MDSSYYSWHDTSNITYNNTIVSIWEIEPMILFSKLVAFASIMFLTILGNGVVIVIILVNKHMRTTTYYYLLNLAIADVSIAVFSEWMWLYQDLTVNWVFGEFLCTFSGFMFGTSVHVSILTLTVVAGDRCFAIVYPLKSRVVKSSGALVSLAIILVWALAILLNIPLLFTTIHIEHVWSDGVKQHWCTEDVDSSSILVRIYSLSLVVLTYVVPLLLMLIAYVLIANTLNSRGAGLECTTTAQDRSKRKVIKMLMVVVCTFAICWLPYHVYQLIRMFHLEQVHSSAWFGVMWLGYANSAMNPFIYCGFNENFRRGFRDTFQRKFSLLGRKKNIDFKSFKSSQSCAHSDGTIMETSVM